MTQSAAQPAATTHAPGTPIWVDLGSPDTAASTRFYNQLFGWRSEDMGEESGHYNMFFQGDQMVAAVGPLQNPQQPPAWTTYISTTDANATAKKVTDAGGQVLMPPSAVMDQGSMAIFMDPAGGAFAVWQPEKMTGAGVFNTPVSLTWNELHSRDTEAAKAFYPKVFGWGVKANQMPGMGEYIEWQVSGKSIAGAVGMNMEPEGMPSYWLVYFSVANTDEIVKRTPELGGKVLSPAMDIPNQGRFAVLADPQGAAFAVIQNTPQ